MVPELRPDYLVLSVTMPRHLDDLAAVMQRLEHDGLLPPVIVGGQALIERPNWAERHGAHFLGSDMLGAIGQLARLAAGSR